MNDCQRIMTRYYDLREQAAALWKKEREGRP